MFLSKSCSSAWNRRFVCWARRISSTLRRCSNFLMDQATFRVSPLIQSQIQQTNARNSLRWLKLQCSGQSGIGPLCALTAVRAVPQGFTAICKIGVLFIQTLRKIEGQKHYSTLCLEELPKGETEGSSFLSDMRGLDS
jgi:hypothetical protein